MELSDRALLNLQSVLNIPGKASQPRYAPLENRYLEFKERVNKVMGERLGAEGSKAFFEQYFIEFLPALLQAAAEHEKLDQVECAAERAMLDELPIAEKGLLSHSPMAFPLNRKLLQQVPEGGPALDLGIGSGQNSRFSMGKRPLDLGADVMLSNLLQARSLGRHKNFVALDMAALPFLDGAFERVYALNCIYHAQCGRFQALAEMSRVLGPGGILALTDASEHVGAMKPLTMFFDKLGFHELAREFDSYFLSGYGADGSLGAEHWYREHLAKLGFEDTHFEYWFSQRLCSIAYLFYDWQALFNTDAQGCFGTPAGKSRFLAKYRPMLMSTIAPLLKLDAELCKKEKKGGYIFIMARKRASLGESPKPARPERAGGDSRQIRWACPACRVALQPNLQCGACARKYPEVENIPLLTTFYAEAMHWPAIQNRASA